MSHQSLIDAFLHQVARQPDRIALIFASSDSEIRRCTWRELASLVDLCAAEISRRFDSDPALRRQIGHASDNSLADVVIALASMSVGAVEVPIDHRLAGGEVRRRWDRVGGLWVDQNLRMEQRSSSLFQNRSVTPLQVELDDPSLILWTSGTTGKIPL